MFLRCSYKFWPGYSKKLGSYKRTCKRHMNKNQLTTFRTGFGGLLNSDDGVKPFTPGIVSGHSSGEF